MTGYDHGNDMSWRNREITLIQITFGWELLSLVRYSLRPRSGCRGVEGIVAEGVSFRCFPSSTMLTLFPPGLDQTMNSPAVEHMTDLATWQ